jgi:hypothetical protein
VTVRSAIVFVAVWMFAVPSAGQQVSGPAPSFRVEIDAVQTDVSVTDAAGNPVTDLTTADFEILEDGRRQVITSFVHINIPRQQDVHHSQPRQPTPVSTRTMPVTAGCMSSRLTTSIPSWPYGRAWCFGGS